MTRPGPLMFRTCRSRFPSPGAASLFVLLPALLTAVPAAANVGRTTAVVQQARGTPPRQTTRVLIPKMDLFENERIQTNDRGVTQVLFQDGTNLTVGPNSDLVIDRFVYDPDTSVGELAAELGRGVLRFVGGQISKWGRAAITTPVAVIGVRGGIAVVEHDEAGGTNAVLLFGSEMTVEGLGPRAKTRRVTRPGFSVTVGSDGAVSNPERLPADRLESVLASLEGSEESDGGAPVRPTRVAVQGSAYATTAPPASQLNDYALRAPEQDDPGIIDEAPNDEEVEREQPSPPALWRYGLNLDEPDFGLPFLSSVTGSIYPLTIVKREGDLTDATGVYGYHFLRARTQFSGQGTNQAGAVIVYVGLLAPHVESVVPLQTTDEVRFFGRLAGSARDASSSPTKGVYLIWGEPTEDPASHPTPAFDSPYPPETFHVAAGYYSSDGQFHPDSIRVQAHIDRSETSSPGNAQWVLEDSLPLEQAGPRGDRLWHGYATALFEARTSNDFFEGTYSLSNRNGSPTDVHVETAAWWSGLGAVFRLGDAMTHEGDPASRTNASGNFVVTDMEINFGAREGQPKPDGIVWISQTRGTYVSDDAFAGISSVGLNADGRTYPLVFVNGRLVYREHHATRVWMLSNDAAPADALLPPGVEFCECPAAKFGWWGGHIGLFGGGPDGVREDAVFPGTFVVGQLPEIADVPSEGTASYAGHAAAAIRSGGAAYTAVGGFNMDWNFAARSGEARITNLDGRDYAASNLFAPLTNPRDFSGQLTQNGGPAAGPIAGSFFSDGSNPVRDTGGQFRVQGGSYTAVGSFAATH